MKTDHELFSPGKWKLDGSLIVAELPNNPLAAMLIADTNRGGNSDSEREANARLLCESKAMYGELANALFVLREFEVMPDLQGRIASIIDRISAR